MGLDVLADHHWRAGCRHRAQPNLRRRQSECIAGSQSPEITGALPAATPMQKSCCLPPELLAELRVDGSPETGVEKLFDRIVRGPLKLFHSAFTPICCK